MRRIKITEGSVAAEAELLDNRTADAIWNALPLKARGNTWGDEIYPRRSRLLAAGACVLHLFRAHANEPWQRDSAGLAGQRVRQDRRRRDGVPPGPFRGTDRGRARSGVAF